MKTPNQVKIERRWQRLDPIFILGRQRTGTSIMWRALQVAGFLGFPEGHLWFDLVESFARLRDPTYQGNVRQDIFTLGSGRNLMLEKRFAVMMDRFHRDLLGPDVVRWVDKSPGVRAVRLAPMLAALFPRSQFVFMLRNPITVANSTIHYLYGDRDSPATGGSSAADSLDLLLRTTCKHWVEVMAAWRKVRPLLTGRCIEVAQEHIAEAPGEVARRLAEFMGVPHFGRDIADVFRSRRENTAFPERDVGDFFYAVNWTDRQKAILAEVCREEMAVWGYPLDFQCPAGPNPAHGTDLTEPMDMAAYYRWLEGQNELALELAECKELLARIERGRVMRALNTADRLLHRLRLR